MLSAGSLPAVAAELLVLPPTVVGSGYYAQDVHSAIIRAAERREWRVIADRPGLVMLEFRHGTKCGATISVNYSPSRFRISYVKSFGLDYKKSGGSQTISRRYNRWISTLEKEIRKAL